MEGHGVVRRRALAVGALGVATAGLLSAGAMALAGYSVKLKVPSTVSKGQTFTAKATGSASNWAHLYIYLDTKKCASTWSKEAQRDSTYKTGHSYFLQHAEGGTVKGTYYYAAVKGSFSRSPKAHAGSPLGQQHACAYLVSADKFGNYSITADQASAQYTVKK